MENDKPENPAPEAPRSRVGEMLDKATGAAAAAKISGKVHETAGKLKQKVGEIREIRELVNKRIGGSRDEYRDLMRKQAVRLLDSATDYLEDLKKKL